MGMATMRGGRGVVTTVQGTKRIKNPTQVSQWNQGVDRPVPQIKEPEDQWETRPTATVMRTTILMRHHWQGKKIATH